MGYGGILAFFHASVFRPDFCGKDWTAVSSLRGVPLVD
jgi:hypothetical protein